MSKTMIYMYVRFFHGLSDLPDKGKGTGKGTGKGKGNSSRPTLTYYSNPGPKLFR